jgi:transcription elongation GreA/GreB family factor
MAVKETQRLTVMMNHIVADGSADGRGRIALTSPLASAILGLRAEDEAEVVIEGRRRTVLVEEIQEAA